MGPILLLAPALQACAMLIDEGRFHRRRGLPRWERLGHPLDTLSAAACYAWLAFAPPAASASLEVYVLLAAFSCLLITKDEFVHVQACEPREMWLHALLFVLHPIVFLSFGLMWWWREWHAILFVQLAATLVFAAYQFIYWSFYADQHRPHSCREQRSLRDARGPLVRSDGRSDRAAPR